MTSLMLDNSAEKDIKSSILWQFDNAAHLVAFVGMISDFFDDAVKAIWDKFTADSSITFFSPVTPQVVLPQERTPTTEEKNALSDFILSSLGNLLGLERPTLTRAESGSTPAYQYVLSKDTYRRLIIGTFRLLNSDGHKSNISDFTVDHHYIYAYTTYANSVFGAGDTSSYPFYAVEDYFDMAVFLRARTTTEPYGEENFEKRDLYNQCRNTVMTFPAGVNSSFQSDSPVLGFEGQQTNRKYCLKAMITGPAGTEIPSNVRIRVTTTPYSSINVSYFDIAGATTIGEDGTVVAKFFGADLSESYHVIPYNTVNQFLYVGTTIDTTLRNLGVRAKTMREKSYKDFAIENFSGANIAWNRFH